MLPYRAEMLLKTLKKVWPARLIVTALFTLSFVAVVILFFKSFVSGADTADSVKKIGEFFSIETSPFLEKLSEPFAFGKTKGEALSVGLYALFALPFALLFTIFIDVFTKFYIYRIRPRLKKARLVK